MEKTKEKRSVKKIISDIAFGIIMAFMGLVVIFSIIDKTVGFSISGHHILWVRTNSMETTIPASSYILVKDVDASEVKVDDVITFVSEDDAIKGQLNTHRVIEITPAGNFVTKGDNNPGQDTYQVKPEEVKYLYEKNLPFISLFGRLFITPAGYVITVVGIVGLIAVWFTIDAKDRKKEQKQKLIDEMVEEEIKRLESEANKKD